MEDPPSPWCVREFMTLDSLHEAKKRQCICLSTLFRGHEFCVGHHSQTSRRLLESWRWDGLPAQQSGIPWSTQSLIPASARVRFRTQCMIQYPFGSSSSLLQPHTPSQKPFGTGQRPPVLSLLHFLRRLWAGLLPHRGPQGLHTITVSHGSTVSLTKSHLSRYAGGHDVELFFTSAVGVFFGSPLRSALLDSVVLSICPARSDVSLSFPVGVPPGNALHGRSSRSAPGALPVSAASAGEIPSPSQP